MVHNGNGGVLLFELAVTLRQCPHQAEIIGIGSFLPAEFFENPLLKPEEFENTGLAFFSTGRNRKPFTKNDVVMIIILSILYDFPARVFLKH